MQTVLEGAKDIVSPDTTVPAAVAPHATRRRRPEGQYFIRFVVNAYCRHTAGNLTVMC
jgi:hypothetical protein